MIKKAAILLVVVVFLFGAAPTRAQLAPEGGGGGVPRVLSVAAAGFRPNQDGYTYNNAGYWLEHWSLDGSAQGADAIYFAPLHLPHGAVITSLTAYIYDLNTTKSGHLFLVEENLATGSVSSWVAHVWSPAGTNGGFTPYWVPTDRLVQNDAHAYYLRWNTPMEQTPSDQIVLGGVQVGYLENLPTSPGYFSLSQADFTPFSGSIDYTNGGATLEVNSASAQDFQAGVYLPNGARLERMTFYYHGAAGKTVSANLARVGLDGLFSFQAGVSSSPTDGDNSGAATAFGSNQVENSKYACWVYERMLSGPKAYGVVIEYTPKYFSANETIFSVASAAFVPRHGNFTYQNAGNSILHELGGDDDIGAYMAPFSPPQDASITGINFMVGNSPDSKKGEALLLKVSDKFSLDEMWKVSTDAGGGWYWIGSSKISYNPINHWHNMYYLRFNLPQATVSDWVKAVGVQGAWKYKLFLPLERKN